MKEFTLAQYLETPKEHFGLELDKLEELQAKIQGLVEFCTAQDIPMLMTVGFKSNEEGISMQSSAILPMTRTPDEVLVGYEIFRNGIMSAIELAAYLSEAE